MKISVVLREALPKLRDHLLVNSEKFEGDYNKLKAIIQAYLNSNKDRERLQRISPTEEQRQRQEQGQEQEQRQRQRQRKA